MLCYCTVSSASLIISQRWVPERTGEIAVKVGSLQGAPIHVELKGKRKAKGVNPSPDTAAVDASLNAMIDFLEPRGTTAAPGAVPPTTKQATSKAA